MSDLDPRVRAVCDLNVAEAREYGGRHEYDGIPQDLSPAGVTAGLAKLEAARKAGSAQPDPHDEAHLRAAEDYRLVMFADLELHRRNPLFHLAELDLACYDKDYAPASEREAARTAHLAAWPRVIDAAISSLDQVSAPVASSLLDAVRGLAAGIPTDADPGAREAALAAHARLVAHVSEAAASGRSSPDAALGSAALTALLRTAEATDVDLGKLALQADAERDRLTERLTESCAAVDASRPPLDVARELVKDHPDRAGVLTAARDWTARAIDFTRERDLMPVNDGVCLVGEAPESRRWAMAMISTNAPAEPDAPSWYWITPPDPSWPSAQAEEWLEVFSATTLPAITVHEVAPGHFSHHQALRHAAGDVRRTLFSDAFVEGWAHYAEELSVEEGFLADDPRFAIGVWLEALVRVTRLACALGVHTAGWTVDEAAARFATDTHLTGEAALSEARRATFDPTYGRYTWGKLEIMRRRDEARAAWGAGFTLKRFHSALLALGSPPLGLLGTAIERGLSIARLSGATGCAARGAWRPSPVAWSGLLEAKMSDHGDHAVAEHDLTDLYVFRKPGDPAKTILVMDMNPDLDPGVPPPAQPFDPHAWCDFMIDTDGDAVPDSAFRITFSTDDAGRQTGTVRRLAGGDVASSSADGPTVLHDAPVSPATEPLITVEGGIAFFAGRRSDPFFEDLVGRRNNYQWTGKDFLAGHNVSAIVLELPNSDLGSHPPVGIWARVCVPHGQGEFLQADRIGRPFANVVFNSGDKEAQNTFNQSQPAQDRGLFLDRFASYLQGTGRSADEAAAVAATLLPDILTYDWTTESRFPNGRTLTDDVSDWTWALLTKGTAPNDGIGPHTDLLTGFPYLGPPHTDAPGA